MEKNALNPKYKFWKLDDPVGGMIGSVLHFFDHLRCANSHLYSGKEGSRRQGWWKQFSQGGEQQTWNVSLLGKQVWSLKEAEKPEFFQTTSSEHSKKQ